MDAQRFLATENLFATLERRERSRAWLARKIGVSTSLMYFLTRGTRSLSLEKAAKAAAVLDEPIDWLFVATSASKDEADVSIQEAA